MSFILDALKRADQERRQEPVTIAFDGGSDLHEGPTASRGLSVIIGAGILLVPALALITYFAFQALNEHQSPKSDTAAEVAQVPAEAPASNLKTSVNADSAVAQQPTPNNDTPGSEAPEPEAPESAEEIDSLYSATPTEELPDPAVEELYRAPEPQAASAQQNRVAEKQPRAAFSMTPQAQTPIAPVSEPALPAIAQIRDLPWSLQQKIPSISYSSHHYEESGQSHVVINGKQRRAGQQLANNLRLEEVLADGVVMSFEGRRFKLPALSSWVNM